jgi:transglutaminase-like putative cysteine protease
MNRRGFLGVSGAGAIWARDRAQAANGRTFDVTTRVEILKPSGATRVWLPAALGTRTPYQETISNKFTAHGGVAHLVSRKADGLEIVAARFPAGVKPVLELTSRIATRDHAVDLSGPGLTAGARPSELDYFRRSTRMLPTDGIVKEKAVEITASEKTDLGKARAIYEWIVQNTFRDPKTRGCGLGNIRYMLESGDLGGKCADLNALFVGLARASGLPARDVYGIRIARSELGYKSLGASSQNVTKAQHCRAEVYLTGRGWVPVDPADVRKVVLEEPPGNRPLDDEMVSKARARLFGSWEMNWMAYNFAHDVALPGSSGPPVAFMMYPQAETGEGRVDTLNPEAFRYEIESAEVTTG